MYRIALLTPMLQPYRITFYEKLSKSNPDNIWMIFHGVKCIEDGRPGYDGSTNFCKVGLKEYKFRIGPYEIEIHKHLKNETIKFNPDFIILQSIGGNLSYRKTVNWAYRNHRKIIMWAPGWEPNRAKGPCLLFKNIFVRSFLKKADYFLTYCSKATKYIESMDISPSKIRECYNGIETDNLMVMEEEIRLKAIEIRKRISLINCTSFLYVGGLIREKKIKMLIKAFILLRKSYPNIKLIIIGDGPLRNEVLNMLERHSDSEIYYLGRILDDVDPYFAACDCLVMPGIGGLALAQAMFWRKICIVSKADGTEDDLIQEGVTGFRFENDNLLSLQSAMVKVINADQELLTSMGINAKKIITENYNVNCMVRTINVTINEMICNT